MNNEYFNAFNMIVEYTRLVMCCAVAFGHKGGKRFESLDNKDDYSSPKIFLLVFLSLFTPAKSSNERSVSFIICCRIKEAPSTAPCSLSLIQHSHSRTAHPSYSYCSQFTKDGAKINFSVTGTAETSGTIYPILVSSINSSGSIRIKFSILDMKCSDTVFI